jgi:hypothetical protein
MPSADKICMLVSLSLALSNASALTVVNIPIFSICLITAAPYCVAEAPILGMTASKPIISS